MTVDRCLLARAVGRARVLFALAVAVLLFGGVAGAARAAVVHPYLSQVTAVPPEGPLKEVVPAHGPLGVLLGLTVQSGSLWVSDREGGFVGEYGRVDRFGASTGAFEGQLPLVSSFQPAEGVAVRGATLGLPERELYVGGRGSVAVFGPSGELQATWSGADTPLKTFATENGISDVAVDNNSEGLLDWAAGDVYVALAAQTIPEQNVVDVFKPLAGGGEEYVGQLPGPHAGHFGLAAQRSVAVDEANGDVIVAEGESAGTNESPVYVFEPATPGSYVLVRTLTGTPRGAFNRNGAVRVAVDGGAGEGSGDLYVADGSGKVVYEFGPAGEFLGELTGAGSPAGRFTSVAAVAVDPATHDVYAGDEEAEGGVVDVFGPTLFEPDVAVAAASALTASTAVLNGTLNPLSAQTHEGAVCEFEYGTSTAYGQSVKCSAPVGEGNSPAPVHSLQLSALAPGTTYFYRLAGSDGSGTNRGVCPEDCGQFHTKGPSIGLASAALVTATSVSLQASIDPNSAPTSYRFEYDTRPYVVGEGGHGTSVPVPDRSIGSAPGAQQVQQHVQGLTPGTVYHYRVVAPERSGTRQDRRV